VILGDAALRRCDQHLPLRRFESPGVLCLPTNPARIPKAFPTSADCVSYGKANQQHKPTPSQRSRESGCRPESAATAKHQACFRHGRSEEHRRRRSRRRQSFIIKPESLKPESLNQNQTQSARTRSNNQDGETGTSPCLSTLVCQDHFSIVCSSVRVPASVRPTTLPSCVPYG
jgi:hypothetical protein